MCPKSYKSQRIISYLGSQLWMFLSQNTVSSLAFFPTLQIYSTCSLAHHGTIPDSMSTDIFFDLPEPNPTMGHPPSAFPTSPTVYEAQLLEDQSVWGLAQWKFRCHNVITSSCCLLLLCWGILLSVILTVAIWRTSVFKLPSSLSTDHQTTYLNSSSSFFFFTKMIQFNMCELHQLNLSSIRTTYLYIFFFVLIFTFKEETASLCPRSVILKLGWMLESTPLCGLEPHSYKQLGDIRYFT